MQGVATSCSVLHYVAVSSVPSLRTILSCLRVAEKCSLVQSVAVSCNVLQHVAVSSGTS